MSEAPAVMGGFSSAKNVPPSIPEGGIASFPLIESAIKMAKLMKDRGKEWVEKAKRLADREHKTVATARALDVELLRSMATQSKDLAATLERIRSVESLTLGHEMEKKSLGQLGVNEITRRQYEGDPPRTAYVKNVRGETHYSNKGKAMRWDDKTLAFQEDEKTVVDDSVKAYASLISRGPMMNRIKTALAEKYHLKPEEVPYDSQEIEPRLGFPTGESAVREYAISRLDMMMGLDTVPTTVLRNEHNDGGLCSVQEAATSRDKRFPCREMYKEEVDILFDLDP